MRDLEKPPGNARVAAALLDALTAVGHGSARNRAERALEDGSPPRRRRTDWIDPERLRDAFRAAQAGPQIARRMGRLLVAPQAMGLLLSYTGIATPEKAYRRCDRLLPRDRQGDRFEAVRISEGRARIAFHPAEATPADVLFCEVRTGMLEAMTQLYGLLPARVNETACAHRGAPACVYEVRWRRTPRIGLALGGLAGVVLGAGAGAGLVWLAGVTLPVASVLGVAVCVAAVSTGRSVDLARQLDALAKGGLGHLALLDQADGVLAEKMDLLAKLETAGTKPTVERTLGSTPLRRQDPAPRTPGVARRLHRPVASLERALEELREALAAEDRDAVAEALDDCGHLARELHALGAEAAGHEPLEPEPADLADIVRRGVATVRSARGDGVDVAVSIEPDPAAIACRPFQLEQVVVQLVTNAVEAEGREGPVEVELRRCPEGFEVSVSDDGDGIDPEVLDDLFDPFFDKSAEATAESGFGLTICYRIVKSHGGELAVHSEPGRGTRVAVVLPAND